MNNRKYRIAVAVVLALGLGTALLAGCGAGGGSGQGTNGAAGSGSGQGANGAAGGESGQEANGTANGGNGQGADGAAGGAVPMGRYMEEESSLPDEAGQMSFLAMLRGKDGGPELYLETPYEKGKRQESRRFLYSGTKWQEDARWNKWLNGMIDSGQVCGVPGKIACGLDGNYYFFAPDDGYIFHLYQILENGGVREWCPKVFEPKAGQNYGLIPSQIDVTADGRLLIHDADHVYCYRSDGGLLFTMDKSAASSEDSVGYVEGEEFVTITDNGVTRYSLDDGRELETVPFDDSVGDTLFRENNKLFGDGNGGVYLASRKGLFHVNRGGSLWEQIIDGNLTSLGMESRYLCAFLAGNENDFYGCVTSGTQQPGVTVCHYTYDPDMASVPQRTLTVYSLRDSGTIRQAASVFQRDHPDVLVDVRSVAEAGEEVPEDTIRALNTEILNGKGADVLVLDGLPADAYREKGVLMDLRDVFAEIRQESPLLEPVAGNFTEADGAVYRMPARLTVPVVTGLPEAAKAWQSLEGIRDYHGEKPLQYTQTYENLLRQVASLHYGELFGEGAGMDGQGFDRARLVTYLETVKALGQSCGAKAVFTDGLYINGKTVPDGITGTGFFYDAGLADSGVDEIVSISNFSYQVAFLENNPGAAVGTIGGVYFPKSLVGVNQATAEPQLAREFVKCVFSTEVQKEVLGDGFPVNREGLDIQFAAEGDSMLFAMGFPEWDYSISASYPDEEDRARLRALIDGLSQPVVPDETLMEMIVSGAMDYCEDQISAEQAASAIEQQILLYQAEKG